MDQSGEFEVELGQGLLSNHAYSIIDMRQVNPHQLLRIRNPWGQGEWQGDWSDGWDGWTDTLKKQLDYVDEDDGTFWMSSKDFAAHFTDVYLCDIIPNRWNRIKIRGEWKGETAGGCMNNRDTWGNNPQFKLSVSMPTEVVIMIMQDDHHIR